MIKEGLDECGTESTDLQIVRKDENAGGIQ